MFGSLRSWKTCRWFFFGVPFQYTEAIPCSYSLSRDFRPPEFNFEGTTMKKLLLVLFIILGSVSIAAADTIYLRGGTTLRGNVLGFTNGRFAIQLTSNATLTINPSNDRNQSNFPSNTTATTRNVTAGEVIFLRPRDIERIEIDGRSLDDARYQTRTVDVALESNWIDSG